MKKVLFVYTSRRGQVLKILNFLKSKLNHHADIINLMDEKNFQTVDIANYDYVVVSSSIKYGAYHKNMYKFVNSYVNDLNKVDNCFLSVNLTARKQEKRNPDTSMYIKTFYKKSKWFPKHVHLEAGLLDYPSYGLFDTYMIKFIMTLTKGVTDTSKTVEFTDYNKLEGLADYINNKLA